MTLAARSKSLSDRMGRRGNCRIRSRYFSRLIVIALFPPELKVLSKLIPFPVALLIIFVGQHRTDENFSIFVVDIGDQPEFIATYIEYYELVRGVRRTVSRPNVSELAPFHLSDYLVPLLKR